MNCVCIGCPQKKHRSRSFWIPSIVLLSQFHSVDPPPVTSLSLDQSVCASLSLSLSFTHTKMVHHVAAQANAASAAATAAATAADVEVIEARMLYKQLVITCCFLLLLQ